jgi:secreted Zn-dependent insulinase-like peptidase
MLFLGSKKYNKPTYFVDYITQFNGKFNGFTDFETTGFYFKINSDKFDHALEIFSRFFIDPLFSPEYVKKEVNSVNSEYERNIQLDSKRREMVLREIAHEKSLFHRFSTGNTDTLWNYTKKNNIDLRKRVMEYYHAHYRPDNMKLIVYGDQPIEYYKGLVEKYYKDMKKRTDPYNPHIFSKYTKLPWEYNKIGKLVLMKTINNHKDLDINFMLEDVFKTLPNNPALYYKTLLNYRGKGSLDDILRKQGLVAGVKTHLRRTHRGFSFFKIKGYITKNGIKNLDKVISTIFKYIQYIRQKALDIKLYNYIKRIYDLSFFFMNRKKKINKYIKAMCHVMWKYDKKHYFTQHKVLNAYNKEVIEKFGKRLVLKNAIVLVGNRHFDGNMLKNYSKFTYGFNKFKTLSTENVLNKKDPFYFTNYNQFSFKTKFVKSVDSSSKLSASIGNKLNLFPNKKSLPKIVALIKTCPASKKREVTIKYNI